MLRSTFIDELGFDRLEQEDARNASLFFKVIDGRYCKRSTLITTNITFSQLGDYLSDPVVTTAIVDRMVHHSIIINIQGPSWRMHESKKPSARTEKPKSGVTYSLNHIFQGAPERTGGFHLDRGERCGEPEGVFNRMIQPPGQVRSQKVSPRPILPLVLLLVNFANVVFPPLRASAPSEDVIIVSELPQSSSMSAWSCRTSVPVRFLPPQHQALRNRPCSGFLFSPEHLFGERAPV